MNPRIFLTAAATGLACGFLAKPWMRSAGDASTPDRDATALLPGGANSTPPGPPAPAGNWEARISHYLNPPTLSAPAPVSPATNPREEADQLLYLLARPVSVASIREGVALLNASDPAHYQEIMASIFERWAREFPDEALAAASDMKNPDSKAALVWKVFQPAAADPGILTKAMAQPPGMIRSIACAAVAETLPVDRLPELLRQSMRNQSPGYLVEHQSLQSLIFPRLSMADPELPLRLAQETEDPVWRTALLKTALSPLPGNAGKALAQNPQNAGALVEATSTLLRENAGAGIKLLAAMPPENRQEAMRYSLGHEILFQVDDRFKEFANKENFEVFHQHIIESEGTDGFRAILADSALYHGAQGLTHTTKWLATRNDAAGLDDLTRRATRSEPFTTARWLSTMSPSPERDRVVSIFAETHAATDPERATAWAQSIADPAQRAGTLRAVRSHEGKLEEGAGY